MLRCLLIVLFYSPLLVYGQQQEKFLFNVRLTPEKTDHLNQYYGRSEDQVSKSTFNLGLQAMLQYNVNKVVFLEGGLGYVPRTLDTKVIFNQAAIPPPRQSFTEELVTAHQVSYRILQLPLMIGFNLASAEDGRLFVEAGVIGNLLMNARYDTHAKKYEGTYEKGVWLGHTLQIGGGFDLPISKAVWLTFGIDFTLENTVKKDPYLNSHGGAVALTHTYNNGFIGIKIPLRK
jgi:hypothetical protein